MQNIVWKFLLIVVVLALCVTSIVFKDLRLGKDLQGGVSLVYQVNIEEDQNSQEVLTRMISVLKERVNPQGVYDISMQPLGRDRIEIIMPLPNKEVRDLYDAYDAALSELLRESEIPLGELYVALKQGAAVEQFGGDPSTERGEKIAALQDAFDARAGARQALEDAKAAGADAAEIRRLEFEVAEAEIAVEDLDQEVGRLSLGEPRVRRVLALPTTEQKLQERQPDGSFKAVLDEQGDPVIGPSQRETALTAMKAEFPQVADLLDRTVQAHDAYKARRTGLDDPEDLMRLIRGAGVLQFHIAVSNAGAADEGIVIGSLREQLEEVGPENAVSPRAKWFPINQLKQWYDNPEELAALEANPIAYFAGRDLVAEVYQGRHYLLLRTDDEKSMTHRPGQTWSLKKTRRAQDRLGRVAVGFDLDSAGGGLMGRLTGAHIGRPMAIVLDGEVYSAPTIQSQITTNGIITGNFSGEEINYLLRVLAAGSLQAQLTQEPISISVLGPSLGQDNLQRGKEAFIISIIAVAAFMLVYYFFAGLVADLALAANGIIVFGVMMGIDGTFTLPGLAGIVLTIGMAVDANVLIYERIREEIFAGDERDLRGAVRQGYRKALSTILDANITNLIVCFVLFKTATTEVKGFALTLTIGICATLFTALFVTRQIYYLYTDLAKIPKLPMLATVFPAIHRALEPNINWVGLRKIFWVLSILAVIGSGVLVYSRGVDMFDTEFRGGVSMTMATAAVDADGDGRPELHPDTGDKIRVPLPHTGPDGVEQRIRAIGERAAAALAGAADEEQRRELETLAQFRSAAILTKGATETDPETGATMAVRFQIKVASPRGLEDERTITDVVKNAIIEEFGDELDITPPLTFEGAGSPDSTPFVFPIENVELGANIDRPDLTRPVPDFLGGAAIVLSNVHPPATVDDVAARISNMRKQQDFVQYAGRKVEVIGDEPADANDPAAGYTSFVVLVYDSFRSFMRVESEVWYDEVADGEWRLISTALQQPASLEEVTSFSSAVAQTLSAQAIVAVVLTLLGILVYIWVRFGSLRYSVAAIVALVHDVAISLGLLAMSGAIGGTLVASWFKIEPFRIDLGVVAALLTIIGYSLNDTIVILDRIRENRGKLPLPTAPIVNRSINQTVSRTLLTSVTTLMAVLIMYFEGGSGIRPFTFCLLAGLVVGTYSSVAIAAPLVLTGGARGAQPTAERPGGLPSEETGELPATT